MNRGDYQDALELLTKAKELAPKLDKPYYNLGMTYLLMGQRERARQMFEKAVELNPANFRPRVRLSRLLSEDGKPDESVDFLSKAVQANPASAELRSELGATLYRLGRIDEALNQFQKAIDISPLSTTPRVHKGIILLSRGDADGAVREARRALQFSRDARAHNLLGVVYAGKGSLDMALKEFLKAYSLQPRLPTVRDNAANAYMDLQRYAEARRFCYGASRAGHPCSEKTLKRIHENVGTDAESN
jgi:Flp pilus assembly protein TadD